MKKGFTLIETLISIIIIITIFQMSYFTYFNLLINNELKKEAYFIYFILKKHSLVSTKISFILKNNIIILNNKEYILNKKFKYLITNNSDLYFNNNKINSSFKIKIYYMNNIRYIITISNINNLDFTNIRVDKYE